MNFKYSIIPRDLVNLNYFSMDEKALKKVKMTMKFLPLFFLIPMALLRYSLNKNGLGLYMAIGYVLIYIAWLIFYDKALTYVTERRVNKLFKVQENKWLLGERTMTLNDERMIETVSDEGFDKLVLNKSYGEIYDVKLSSEAIYTYINKKSAFIIPRRAFTNDDEMKDVFNFISNKVKDAKNNNEEIIVANQATSEEEKLW